MIFLTCFLLLSLNFSLTYADGRGGGGGGGRGPDRCLTVSLRKKSSSIDQARCTILMMDKVMSGHVADVGQQLAALPTRSVDLPTRPRCRV